MRQRTTLTISSLACVVITLAMPKAIESAPVVRVQIRPSVLSSVVRVRPTAIYLDRTIIRAGISERALVIEKVSSNIGAINASIAKAIVPEVEIANVDIHPLNEIEIATKDDISSDTTQTIAGLRAIAGASIIRGRITADVSAIAQIPAINDAAIASISPKIANETSSAAADLATYGTALQPIHAEKQIRTGIAQIESREIASIAAIRNVLPNQGATIVDNKVLAVVSSGNISIRSSFEQIGDSLAAQRIGISENSVQVNCDSALTPASINPA